MSILEAIILGIVQGLTEFLPISSTGHLTVVGQLMGLISDRKPEEWTAFIAVIQLGTLGSAVVYFWRDIVEIVGEWFSQNLMERRPIKEQSGGAKSGWLIVVGSVPVAVVGLLFKDAIEGALTKSLYVVAGSLIALAIVLAIAEKTARFHKKIEDLTFIDTLIIGTAQAFALIPGSSRSGTTITGGLFVGLNREAAARFSFLLSVPAVLASGALQFYQSLDYLDADGWTTLVVATVVSGASGYAAIDFLIKFLRKNTTFLFIYYRIAAGAAILALLAAGVITT
ncbi:MAG: undecaprenyl-diphosphatase UppP [Ignavibacteriales bacterium]|nr:undecaprenyl-diphosphatase UppP [Ignavibacteriales bacterium]